MATKIVTKNSSTASAVPTASDLVQGELAVNVADKRLFTEDNAGAIVELGTNPYNFTANHNGAAKLATTSTGIDVTGNVALGDNGKATFGAGDDLQIYHDGSHSYVSDQGTGNIKILADDFILKNSADTETMIQAFTDSSVSLWHNNAAKLATTATGIDVTGTATMDVLDASGTGVHDLQRSHSTTTASLAVLDLKAKSNGDMSTGFGAAARFIIEDTANVENVVAEIAARRESSDLTAALTFTTLVRERMRIASNGDISFYEDTGTTPKFFWDASAERIGLGTTSPLTDIHIANSAAAQFLLQAGDSSTATMLFGDSADTNIGWIQYDNSDNNMNFRTNNTERMRIDSAGNLLVGKSAADVGATAGFEWYNTADVLTLTRDAGNALSVNRLTSDGVLATFRKDGTTVGNINTASGYLQVQSAGGNFRWGANNTNQLSVDASQMYPMTDNALNLGAAGVRFKDLYLSGGVYLGGTGAANKLDDYETGTWSGTSSATSGTSSVSDETYTKIGNVVHITFFIAFSGASGGLTVSGLPFSVASSAVGIGREDQTSGYAVYARISQSQTSMNVYYAGATGNATPFQVSAGGLTLNLTYRTS